MEYPPQELQSPSLLDPVSCGEDLFHNATRVSELAPGHCAGCADYHIRSAAHRCAGILKGIAFDRPQLTEMIRKIIAERVAATDTTIEIVIPGSADTGILATCAHAAATLGVSSLDRCRFTVLDRCPTPLLLCQEYAAAHRLSIRTCQVDLRTTSQQFDADLIVAHSVFRFIERADQIAVLDKFGNWLRAGGRMIVSNRLKPDEKAEAMAEFRKRTVANNAVKSVLESGVLRTREPAEKFLNRLKRSINDGEGRPGEFQSLADAQSLFAGSHLRVLSSQSLTWKIELAPDDLISRSRVLAVLSRADEQGVPRA